MSFGHPTQYASVNASNHFWMIFESISHKKKCPLNSAIIISLLANEFDQGYAYTGTILLTTKNKLDLVTMIYWKLPQHCL